MNKYSRYIVSFLLVIFSNNDYLLSKPRRLENAKNAVASFFHQKEENLLCVSNIYNDIISCEIQDPFYIFNDTVQNRFAIISGDDRMQVVLGYADGLFDGENLPDGLMFLLGEYRLAFKYLRENGEDIYYVNRDNLKRNNKKIEPLIETVWGQDIPFNNYTPRIGYIRSASGCVATAMAQIMNYYKYPERGQGYYSYESRTRKFQVEEDFSQTIFDWGNMADNYNRNYTSEQGAAVATLMKSCGVSVAMDYGSDEDMSSGAYSFDVPYAMINNFGYNPNIQYYDKRYYSDDEWVSIIYDELENGRPIYYSGSNKDGGHAFVLDGADGEGRFHFNFGWDGHNNGYFVLSPLSSNAMSYSSNQEMVCHIFPNEIGEKKEMFYANRFSPNKMQAHEGETLEFTVSGCRCYSNKSSLSREIHLTRDIAIGLYDSSLNLIKTYSQTSKDFVEANNGITIKLFFSTKDYPYDEQQTYYLAPVVVDPLYPEIVSKIKTSEEKYDHYKVNCKDGVIYLNDSTKSRFTESGINYSIINGNKNYVSVDPWQYQGNIIIPEYVVYDNVEYTVTEITDRAFMLCYYLKSVSLPSTLVTVGSWAFDSCTDLEYVECAALIPPTCKYNVTYPFADVAKKATLYVPIGTEDQYRSAEGWSEFQNIYEKDMNEASISDVQEDTNRDIYTIRGNYIGKMNCNEMHKQERGFYIIDGRKIMINK